MINMEIRNCDISIKLLDKLYQIEKQCFEREALTKQQLVYLFRDYNNRKLVAFLNNETAGFAITRLNIGKKQSFGHILTVDVAPAYRRRGIAQKILQEIEILFKDHGISESRLEVRENNIAALNLYHKLGYKEIAKLERYYGKANGLYLRKKL